MQMSTFDLSQIQTPTLVFDEGQARKNIKRMAAKAAAQHIRFRPHFKTHQSAQVGQWFRDEGVESITVSSLTMAQYFAENGWEDILVAFPVNLREMEAINALAGRVWLGLLVESCEVVDRLEKELQAPVGIWIKIDTGAQRTGIDAMDVEAVLALVNAINQCEKLNLRGLLTHAGQTYHAESTDEIKTMYAESCRSMLVLKRQLEEQGIAGLEVSVGDTPGCWLSEDLGEVDEMRPGNFVFFDAMMMDLGVCAPEDVALAVACPIVSLHPERGEVVIYGGAVHLSKDVIERDGMHIYGYAAFPQKNRWEKGQENGWSFAGRENYVRALSQEHGVVCLEKSHLDRLNVGNLLYILPAHSCLAVDALGEYRDTGGARISTMLSCP
jgi:D-serine deaminase-like pyridoxal phosphate-dependent protein